MAGVSLWALTLTALSRWSALREPILEPGTGWGGGLVGTHSAGELAVLVRA